jgi:hypothetical protein
VLRAQHKWATMLLSFFECFPYVCPEPVLVKRSFIYINGVFFPRLSRCGP